MIDGYRESDPDRGIGIHLVGVALTLVEVRRAYGEVQPPRPDYARVQQTLLHDALHARS